MIFINITEDLEEGSHSVTFSSASLSYSHRLTAPPVSPHSTSPWSNYAEFLLLEILALSKNQSFTRDNTQTNATLSLSKEFSSYLLGESKFLPLILFLKSSSNCNSSIFLPFWFFFCLFVCFFCLFAISGAAPAAYGGSHARGRIRALAAGLHHSHSNAGSKPLCHLHQSMGQHWILKPLSMTRG